MSIPLREQEVKIALINWLYINGHLNDATIINEMVVANWARRADLAVANGNLHAFEIKSDFDSLKRLEGQLSTFSSRFEQSHGGMFTSFHNRNPRNEKFGY